MLAHHEAVADQVVERVRQAGDLRGRAVARGDHLVLLALHHRPRGGLGQEREGLARHEAEADAQQIVPQPRPGRRRIFLHRQDAGVASVGDVPQLQGLATEDDAHRMNGRAEVAEDDRNRRAPTCQNQSHHLHRLGEPETVTFIQAEPARRVAVEILDQVPARFLDPLEVGGLDLGVRPPRRLQATRQGRGAIARLAAGVEDEGDEELIDPEPTLRDPIVVERAQFAGEVRAEAGGPLEFGRAAHHMVPDRQAIVGQIAPGLVQLDMPVVQIARIRGLETGPVDLENHHQGAVVERHHGVGDVARVGQMRPGVGLAPQAHRADAALSHGPAPSDGSAG